ncbi:MAG: hypothetical protein HRU10_07210 [Opitutales bacterium]|nr:hypothetical protein [Opitutales bacterium]
MSRSEDTEVALHFAAGGSELREWIKAHPGPQEQIERIVLGALDYDAMKGEDLAQRREQAIKRTDEDLHSNLAELFPNLKCLHLWCLKEITEVPVLPKYFRELDVRGCVDLKKLPDLPESLELLDLSYCTALPQDALEGYSLRDLMYFHIDGCAQLDEAYVEAILRSNRGTKKKPSSDELAAFKATWGAGLKEFTAENCGQWTCLRLPRSHSLRKLDLSGCTQLAEIKNIDQQRSLHHLNVNGCEALKTIDAFYPGEIDSEKGVKDMPLQYFTCDGCDSFSEFLGMDIRSIHRSSRPDHNVAETFKMLCRHADSVDKIVMSKVLLLGSGRCGKTTIAKALRYYDQSKDERNAKFDPATHSDSTEGIHCIEWKTDFRGPGVTETGIANIWDFGGQELYHNTHRLFASEGSVYIIALTDPDTQKARVESELGERSEEKVIVYKKENEYREIKYWLDYIRTVQGIKTMDDFAKELHRLSIHIVYTGSTDSDEAVSQVKAQAGEYLCHVGSDIPITVLDFPDEKSSRAKRRSAEDQFQPVAYWLKRALFRQADAYGMRGPSVFRQASELVSDRIRSGKHEESFADWTGTTTELSGRRWSKEIHVRHAKVIAQYLHDCGRLFWLKNRGQSRVVFNQQWACDLVYALMEYDHKLVETGMTRSYFNESDFKKWIQAYEPLKNRFTDLWTLDFFVGFLDQCQICIRVGKDRMVAVQSALLPHPKMGILESALFQWNKVAGELGETAINHSFCLSGKREDEAFTYLIGNSDYRDLLANLCQHAHGELQPYLFGDNKDRQDNEWYHSASPDPELIIWEDGFQLHLRRASDSDDPSGQLIIRVEWQDYTDRKSGRRTYNGGLYIQLLCTDE